MAVEFEDSPARTLIFGTWTGRWISATGASTRGGLSDQATRLIRPVRLLQARDGRATRTLKALVLLADGEVISPKPDLPSVSSGETAGIVRRIAHNLVQHTPNVEIINQFDDDSPKRTHRPAHPPHEDHRL